MNRKNVYLIQTFFAVCVLFTSSCLGASKALLAPKTVFVGSTPGGPVIKSMLSVGAEKEVDFIRWDLTLNDAGNSSKTFKLNILFGIGEPNTPGFKGGGEASSFEGVYSVSKGSRGEVYKLSGDKMPTSISMLKLSENLFHLLTPDNKLMVGNGGWSYTLNRKERIAANAAGVISWKSTLLDDQGPEMEFDGRTPCVDLGRQYDLKITSNCLKLKWKITFRRDPKTNQPTSYTVESTLNRPKPIEGNWAIIKGTKAIPDAIILQLDPDKPTETVSFLVGDENVLFFLDRDLQLRVGNEDFGFTLNRFRR